MKSYKIIKLLICTIVLTIITANIVFAEEQVVLNTDEKIADVYLGTKFNCTYTYKGKFGESGGTTQLEFEKASLKKIVGKLQSSYCPNGWAKLKGKVKGNTVVFKISGAPRPCFSGWKTTEKIYQDSDGNYLIKGISTYKDGAKSENTCVQYPN